MQTAYMFNKQTLKSSPTSCSLLCSSSCLCTDWQIFFAYALSFVTKDACDQYRTCFLEHTKKFRAEVVPEVVIRDV